MVRSVSKSVLVGSALAVALLAVALIAPAAALAGWGTPEAVEPQIRGIGLAPGGLGFVIGFPATSPSRLRFELRPAAGPLGEPQELPSGMGQHTLLLVGFDEAGDSVIVDPEPGLVAWRSAAGQDSTTQKLEGHLFARIPRMLSVAPSGAALIGFNELRNGGSPVQLAFRPAGPGGLVDDENTVDLTTKGTLIGLQLQADGGAIAVYIDETGATPKLMQAVRRAGHNEFEAPTEVPSPAGTKSVTELTFSSDPSGWAMLTAAGRAGESGPYTQILGSVRAPDGTFPAATVASTSASIANVSSAVTAAGDGLVTWREGGVGNPLCTAFTIRGVPEHKGAWGTRIAVGPEAWPDETLPAYATTAFASGNDIAVPMIDVHADGSPCPTSSQTRSLIVHHYRSEAAGLTDQGTSQLSTSSAASPVLLEGLAMEPAGKILAWYRVGEERFLRAFDGVTPGAGSTPIGPQTPGGGGGAGGGGGSTGGGSGTGPAPKPAPPILPLRLQQFAIAPTIDPASLEFEMRCPPSGEESCQGRAFFYYLLTGKQIKPAVAFASGAGTKHLALIATGTVKIKAGAHGRVKMTPNALGRRLLRSGKKLKISLKLAVREGSRSLTDSLPATVEARHGG